MIFFVSSISLICALVFLSFPSSAWFSFSLLLFYIYITGLTSLLLIYSCKFLLNIVLAVSHKFGFVVFSFPLISNNFNLPGIYLIHWLLSVLFISTYLWIFQISLLLISSFIPGSENILCMISLFNNYIESCFMTWYIVYPETVLYALSKTLFCSW